MMRHLLIICLVVLLVSSSATGTPMTGGIGLMYVKSAQTLSPGYLDFNTGTRYFGKIASFGSDQKAYTLWTVRIFSSINYGINDHIELAISPVLYQDTNKGGSGFSKESVNFPDDILLSLKFGSYGSLESPFLYGSQLSLQLPTARKHNIIYEAYSAGKIEVGLTGLISYYSNLTFPNEGWSIHGNIGYLNHNDVGVDLTDDDDDPSPNAMSSEILFGAGALFPAGTFDFSVELNARAFLNHPPVTAYSREYVSYLTPAIYYKPARWISIEYAMDLRLLSGDDVTEYSTNGTTHLPPPPTANFPNYPSWRGILGVKVDILPRSLYHTQEKAFREKATDRRRILEKMLDSEEDTESAEEELVRIQSERRRVEEELERLRKLLEDEKSNN
ncbi:hypothetical protein HQ585_11125 [candidate division KSB1 bacterium]|nr:hypothetical protein [candidate division KSB1 bacterium]